MPFPIKHPLEALLFSTDVVAVGTFRCAPDHPLFPDSGPSTTYCIAFGRRPVWIQHPDSPAFLGGPAVVTLYNEGQTYTRRRVGGHGDHSDWFAIAPGVLDEVMRREGVRTGRGGKLFAVPRVPGDARTFLEQRRIVDALAGGGAIEPLSIEERVLGVLKTVVGRTTADRGSTTDSERRRRALVEDAKLLLTLWSCRRLRLSDLARQLGCSPYHLCRTFAATEGRRMHAYQRDVRLAQSLEMLMSRPRDVTSVALGLGFSSHSHFTSAFRRTYGLTPSAYVRGLRCRSGGFDGA